MSTRRTVAPKKKLYTISEACFVIGKRRSKVYQLLSEKRLIGVKLDGSTLVTAASIEKLIAGLPPAEIGKGAEK